MQARRMVGVKLDGCLLFWKEMVQAMRAYVSFYDGLVTLSVELRITSDV